MYESKNYFRFAPDTEPRDLLKMNLIVMGNHGSSYRREVVKAFTLVAELGGFGTVVFDTIVIGYLIMCKPYNLLGAGRAFFEF